MYNFMYMTLSHALAKYSLTRLTGSLPFSGSAGTDRFL